VVVAVVVVVFMLFCVCGYIISVFFLLFFWLTGKGRSCEEAKQVEVEQQEIKPGQEKTLQQ